MNFNPERCPQTLLLVGRSSSALEEEALSLAQQMVASTSSEHPDITFFRPEGKLALHSADKMREFKEESIMPPFQAKRRVFILLEAEKMWPQAANGLLKTLEEPIPSTYFILTTLRKERLLPTILSRCQCRYVRSQREEYSNEPLQKILSTHYYPDVFPFFEDVKKLSQYLDEFRKGEESFSKDLTASQREQLEKEADGIKQLQFQEELDKCFELIAQYHKTELDKVLKLIQEAKLKRERSSTLTSILESLFIKLGYV